MLWKRSSLKGLKLLSVVFVACVLQGCMSLLGTFGVTGTPPCNRVYIGTRAEFRFGMLTNGIGFIDLPFSFVLDTLFLPYTIPSSIQECGKRKDEEEKRKQNEMRKEEPRKE